MSLGPAAPLFSRISGVKRALVGIVPALVVALPPYLWVRDATVRASLTTLGRDQGIFQYVAWAILRGDVDYRDVRDVNGPLTHLIHVAFLLLGGRDEHRFRQLDFLVTGISFAVCGACLPGALSRERRTSSAMWLTRAAWAAAAWVALSTQYLTYLYWDLAQRESFFDWFMLPSVTLGLLGQARLAHGRGSLLRRGALLAVSGALSAIPWFGKPTYAAFTLVQLVALALDDEIKDRKLRRFAPFLLGFALGALPLFAFLFRYGDARAFLRITLHDVPAMYRFMMPRTPSEILGLQWGGIYASLSLVTGAVILGLVWDRQMPRRAIAIALVPIVGLASVVAQGKGFPYHFHPVTAGLYLQWLFLVAWLTERFSLATSFPARVVPLVAAAALAARLSTVITSSTHVTGVWIDDKGGTPELREGQDYLVFFRGPDFFPWEMRQTAAYLRDHTAPDDRVQTYSMDPYLLFLAERRSATPYIYAYDLNADGALAGSWQRAGLHPTDAQADVIRQMRDEHEDDLLERLQRSPPAAFVFVDKAPLTTYEDSFVDFRMHCPRAAAWVGEHYRETASFGEDHVWLRDDAAASAADPSPTRR